MTLDTFAPADTTCDYCGASPSDVYVGHDAVTGMLAVTCSEHFDLLDPMSASQSVMVA